MDRTGALAALRHAVAAAGERIDAQSWCVALSDGPDSLALTAVAAQLRPTVALASTIGSKQDPIPSPPPPASKQWRWDALAHIVLSVDVGRDGGPERRDGIARAGPRIGCPFDCRDAPA